jgi:hypothetical protein
VLSAAVSPGLLLALRDDVWRRRVRASLGAVTNDDSIGAEDIERLNRLAIARTRGLARLMGDPAPTPEL